MLRTKGKAGHSSAPRPDNAIGPPPAAGCRRIPTPANQRGYRRAQRAGSTGQRATVSPLVNGAELQVPRIDEVPPAPRRLALGYAGRRGIVLGVGMGFLAIGLLLSVLFAWGLPVDVAIALSPGETTGTVLDARVNRRAKFDGVHPSTVRYEYEVDGVRWRVGYDALIAPPPSGRAITIEYAAALPGWSRIAGTCRTRFPWFVVAFVLFFPVFGAGMIIRSVRANRREVRAFTFGRPVLARVTFRGQDESTALNGRHPFMIRWEFWGPSGEVFEGALTSMKLLELQAFGQADEVVVLYDPTDPRCNALYVP